jgi:hypothetical protein
MDKFRTEVKIPSSPYKINYKSGILLIGSCFTENIGTKMAEYKFDVDINPFGIVYNPMSVNQNLEVILSEKKYAIITGGASGLGFEARRNQRWLRVGRVDPW